MTAPSSPLLAEWDTADLPARFKKHITNRRYYRIYGLVAVALVFLPAIWLYSGASAESISQHTFSALGYNVTHEDEQNPTAKPEADSNASENGGSLIPPKIWQIMLPKAHSKDNLAIKPQVLVETASWLALNPDYQYRLVGGKGAHELLMTHFAKEPKLIETFNALPNVGQKSDLLRYLLLSIEGGVYTDTDTRCLKAIDYWVPAHLRHKVRLVVGIEFDRRDSIPWADISHWVQFSQWTIAAAPGHPVFRRMADRVLRSMQALSDKHEVPVEQLRPSSFEVMNSTGPAAWTDAVFEQLQEFEPSLNDTKDLAFMKEPTLFGDVLVLTIDGFGMGQPHSNSTNDGSIPEAALMRHLFKGSWRGD